MIACATVGADEMARAKRLYSAFLPTLGCELEEGPEHLSYALPVRPGQTPIRPAIYVKPTLNGHPASAGNGSMVAFEARNQKQVRDFHRAAQIAGGSDNGQPGSRLHVFPAKPLSLDRSPQPE
ncbi:MAG: VOC family protein [Silicimonas sp.]|nr:VOC family protein [Silicimonas sp.]